MTIVDCHLPWTPGIWDAISRLWDNPIWRSKQSNVCDDHYQPWSSAVPNANIPLGVTFLNKDNRMMHVLLIVLQTDWEVFLEGIIPPFDLTWLAQRSSASWIFLSPGKTVLYVLPSVIIPACRNFPISRSLSAGYFVLFIDSSCFLSQSHELYCIQRWIMWSNYSCRVLMNIILAMIAGKHYENFAGGIGWQARIEGSMAISKYAGHLLEKDLG
jgi:hypothetical protein